jgi:hypothetical protein
MQKSIETLEQNDYLDEEAFDDLKEVYAAKIGNYLMNFSALEHSLNTSTADLINDRGHAPGYLIIEKLNFSSKIDLWYKLYTQRIITQGHNEEKGLLKKLKEIQQKLIESNSFRNIIAHANWLSLTHDNSVRSKIVYDSEEGNITFRRYKVTPEILHTKNIECMTANSGLLFFDIMPEHAE